MSGLRALTVMVAALLMIGGCADGAGESQQPTNTAGLETSETTSAGESETTEEVEPDPSEEDPNAEETAANGESGVSIEIAGLPVGSGATLAEGDAWCGVFFWGGSLPSGVELQITEAVLVGEVGGTVLNQRCDGSPPCPDTVISVDTPEQGCAVAVLPPSPDTASVIVRLDGILHCVDQATCDGLDVSGGSTAVLSNPGLNGQNGENSEGSTATAGELGTDEAGTAAGPRSGG
jgi:hypothetical protein